MGVFKPGVLAVMVSLALMPSTLTLASPSEPNNAAILYYQAFLSLPDKNQLPEEYRVALPLRLLPSGVVEPNEVIRAYLARCRTVFGYTRAAVNIRDCQWGLQSFVSDSLQIPQVFIPCLRHIRQLALHVIAQAQVNTADGEYREALENSLIMHRVAEHCGDNNTTMATLSIALHGQANKVIRQVLNLMPPDLATLVWLERELAKVSQRPCLGKALFGDVEVTLKGMNQENPHLMRFAKMCRDGISPDDIARRNESPDRVDGDDFVFREAVANYDFQSIPAFIEGSRDHCLQTMSTIRKALEQANSFKARHKELKRLDQEIETDGVRHPHAFYTSVFAEQVIGLHALATQGQSDNNALKIAIHIYKTKAKTGDIPNTLPAGLPKNRFTDKDFDYEKTDDGFTLRMKMIGRPKDKLEFVSRLR